MVHKVNTIRNFILVLDLVDKGLVTNQIVLTIGYDIENLTNPEIRNKYYGEVTVDHYGRYIPKHAHGTKNLDRYTSSTKIITEATLELYDMLQGQVFWRKDLRLKEFRYSRS